MDGNNEVWYEIYIRECELAIVMAIKVSKNPKFNHLGFRERKKEEISCCILYVFSL